MTRIAVLAIGNELLDGRVSDTNTSAIANALRQVGLKLQQNRCIPDYPGVIAQHLVDLTRELDVLIVSGGLGPTDDDITAAAAAQAFKLELEVNPVAMELLEAFFRHTGRQMHATNRKQAVMPRGAVPIPNPRGSAPAFVVIHEGCRVYFLPGVPREMQAILEETILPELSSAFPAKQRKRKTLKALGIPEAHLQEKLHQLDIPDSLELFFTLDYPLVLITLEASEDSPPELLGDCVSQIRSVLGHAVVAEDSVDLPETVAKLLIDTGKTLSIAESCTGGMVAKLLTDIPGASRFLERSAVTYANSAKQDWLSVPEDLLEKHGAVSAEVAEAMAQGMLLAARSDLALAITGIAGPDGGTEEKPVGTVFISLATRKTCSSLRLQLQGTRDLIRRAAAYRALELLRRNLLHIPYDV